MRPRELALICALPLIAASPAWAHRLPPAPAFGAEAAIPQEKAAAARPGAAELPVSAEPAGSDGEGLIRPVPRGPQRSETETGEAFQWEPAMKQASLFLGIMHGWRLATEPGTREELRGPFLRDYVAAIKGVRGWGDGDPFIVNYVGHPFQGAVSGYIQIHNDPRFQRIEFGRSRLYWTSRLRAMAFAAASSTQFELGPLSEASIGNVGKKGMDGGAVDLVVTPLGGLGVMLAEDALDRLLVRRIEGWTRRPLLRILARGFLNPNRSFANLMRLKAPWRRDNRPGVPDP